MIAPSRTSRHRHSGGDRRKRELAYVDQDYTGKKLAGAARAHGIALELVKSPKAKRGFNFVMRLCAMFAGCRTYPPRSCIPPYKVITAHISGYVRTPSAEWEQTQTQPAQAYSNPTRPSACAPLPHYGHSSYLLSNAHSSDRRFQTPPRPLRTRGQHLSHIHHNACSLIGIRSFKT